SAHRAERDALEQVLHVAHRVDRDPHLAHLAGASWVVAVQSHLGGEVEGHRQAGLTLSEQVAEARVGVAGGAVARVLTDAPEAAPIHRWLNTAGEWRHPRKSLIAKRVVADEVGRGVERRYGDAAPGHEGILALAARSGGLQSRVLPVEERRDEVRLPHF